MSNPIVTPEILLPDGYDRAKALLRTYYGLADGRSYGGASFELIGADESTPNEISAADLVALATLSVPVTAYAAIELMSPEFRGKAHNLLSQIPAEATIDDENASTNLAEEGVSAAAKLWELFSDVEGFGPVSTSKLLARKRPALIPVYDNVVDSQLGLNGTRHMWTRFVEWVNRAEDGSTLIERAAGLAVDAQLPSHVSPLRVIDVVLWMDGRAKLPQAEETADASPR